MLVCKGGLGLALGVGAAGGKGPVRSVGLHLAGCVEWLMMECIPFLE